MRVVSSLAFRFGGPDGAGITAKAALQRYLVMLSEGLL